MKKMKKFIVFTLTASLISCSTKVDFKDEKLDEEIIKEGHRLVTTLGCNDCHSQKKMTDFGPVPDQSFLLSGHPEDQKLADYDSEITNSGQWVLFSGSGIVAVGPWGTSFASNLTPHETGIGKWSFEQFKKAMKEGKSKGLDGGRMLLPPMPWVGYQSLNDNELWAIFRYLQSISPVNNRVPSPMPPQSNCNKDGF